MKVRKKRKFKKRYWLLIDLAVVIVIFALLLYKPAGYNPPEVVSADDKRVSPYLTHELLPQLYNGAQSGEPFEVVVIEKGINDIITRSEWPQETEEVRFSAPVVSFVPESIVLMGTANIKGVDVVVTIVAKPSLNDEGLLNLHVVKVKIGAMNITPLAKFVARRMYARRLATVPIDKEDLRAQIAGSLLNDEPFEPVFIIEGKKVRVESITIVQKKLSLRLVPVS